MKDNCINKGTLIMKYSNLTLFIFLFFQKTYGEQAFVINPGENTIQVQHDEESITINIAPELPQTLHVKNENINTIVAGSKNSINTPTQAAPTPTARVKEEGSWTRSIIVGLATIPFVPFVIIRNVDSKTLESFWENMFKAITNRKG